MMISSIRVAQDRTPADATKALTIAVTKKHLKGAVQCDGKQCVIAKAFADSVLGEYCDGVEIGITITKVTVSNVTRRYATPAKLRPAIREFDKTGIWNLEPGEFTFNPPSATAKLGGRPSRHHLHRSNTDGTGQDKMVSRIAPSRRISRVYSHPITD